MKSNPKNPPSTASPTKHQLLTNNHQKSPTKTKNHHVVVPFYQWICMFIGDGAK